MNHEEKAKEFYRNFFLPSKISKKTLSTTNSKSPEAIKPETPKKRFFFTKSVKEDPSKQTPKARSLEKIEEVNRKYEQDLQLAYYSDLEHFANTFYKKGYSLATPIPNITLT